MLAFSLNSVDCMIAYQKYTCMFTRFLYVQQSYDATTHFESTVMDVLNMYTMITGKVKVDSLLSWF